MYISSIVFIRKVFPRKYDLPSNMVFVFYGLFSYFEKGCSRNSEPEEISLIESSSLSLASSLSIGLFSLRSSLKHGS